MKRGSVLMRRFPFQFRMNADSDFGEVSGVGKVYAGTSGWAYASWKPDFYPAKLPSAKFLAHYSSRLNSVEVNYTLRRFPSQKLLQDWVESTPPEFKFAFKANQRITHFMRLRGAGGQTLDFVGAL